MKQGLTYQLTERKGAADGHSEAVPLSGAFNYIDILEFVRLTSGLFFHQGLCITFLFPLLSVPLTSSW